MAAEKISKKVLLDLDGAYERFCPMTPGQHEEIICDSIQPSKADCISKRCMLTGGGSDQSFCLLKLSVY